MTRLLTTVGCMSTPTLIYARQSKTRDGSESLELQVEACREAAKRLGLRVVGELVEPPSTSGYKNRGKDRAKFKELLNKVEKGQAKAVLVYKSDRLSRGGGPGWAPVFEAFEKAGINLDRCVATPSGFMSEFEIGIRATMDRESSKRLADNMADTKKRAAEQGKPQKGRFRPFGYTKDYEPIPEEVDLIKEACKRVLNGEKLYSICKDWNERGVPTPGGSEWRIANLNVILTHPRNVGLRVSHGQIIGEGSWEPILDKQTWESVTASLKYKTKKMDRSSPRSSLLLGLLYCSECGAKLRPLQRSSSDRHGPVRSYACRPETSARKCYKVSINAKHIEDWVERKTIGVLADPRFRAQMLNVAGEDEAQVSLADELSALEAKKQAIVDSLLASGDLTNFTTQLKSAQDELQKQIDALYEQASAKTGESILRDIPGNEQALVQLWETADLSFKRAMIALVFKEITVAPSQKRGQKQLDEDRLSPSVTIALSPK